MKTTIIFLLVLFFSFSYTNSSPAFAPTPTASFTGLGDIPGGTTRSVALDVSAEGSVVVGNSHSASTVLTEAFRWTRNGGMVGLGALVNTPPTTSSTILSDAKSVSGNGSVVVGVSFTDFGSGVRINAFRWTDDDGMVSLGSLSELTPFSDASGVSADGSVVVGRSGNENNESIEAFHWTSVDGMVGLGYLPGGGRRSHASDVSADGLTVVGGSDSSLSNTLEAFRWTDGSGMVALGDLPGGDFRSEAWETSADGSVVVGNSESTLGTEAFRWTSSGGMVGLGDLPGGNFESHAWGVSADGSIVVGSGASDSGTKAFLWDEVHGMRNLRELLIEDYGLDLTGWTLTSARALSADGKTIVGIGRNPAGNPEAWIATIPEPSSLVLLALAGLAMWRREQRP